MGERCSDSHQLSDYGISEPFIKQVPDPEVLAVPRTCLCHLNRCGAAVVCDCQSMA